MSSTYPHWPEWMPNPQLDSYSIQPEDLRSTTETEVGAIIRPQFETDVLAMDCSLVLNRMQSAWFESFEKTANHDCLWFVFPVWYAGELHDGICSFKDRPKWSVEAYTTTYKFSILVQKRSLEFDPCIMEMLDCWSPCETTLISEELLTSISALDCSTIVPGDLPPCILEMLECWSPYNSVRIGEAAVTTASKLDKITIIPVIGG